MVGGTKKVMLKAGLACAAGESIKPRVERQRNPGNAGKPEGQPVKRAIDLSPSSRAGLK